MGVFSKKSHPRLTRLGALQWLEKRSNFEQQPIGQNHKTAFTLARMRTLLRAIGNPQKQFPAASRRHKGQRIHCCYVGSYGAVCRLQSRLLPLTSRQ